jgi:hypothetical protein
MYDVLCLGERLVRRDVNREFWMMYFVIDENASWYYDDNVAEFAPERIGMGVDPAFVSSNIMFAINGKIYGNVRYFNYFIFGLVIFYM